MLNSMKLFALMALVPTFVLAQSSLDEEVNSELDKMYKARLAQSQAAKEPVSPAAEVQKQPVTKIEAAPLQDSKAGVMRKSRQDAEVSTEQTIVEKLEESRLKDEKKRADVLFGDKFDILNKDQAAAVASGAIVGAQVAGSAAQPSVGSAVAVPAASAVTIVVNPSPAPAVAPTITADKVAEKADAKPVAVTEEAKPEVKVEETKATESAVVSTAAIVPVEASKEVDREIIRSEVSATLAEMKPVEEKAKDRTYVGALLGMGDYPDASNVRPQYASGIAIGRSFNERLVVEGSFLYSNYQVEQRDGGCVVNAYGYTQCYPRITEMNQYSSAGLIKYQLLGGMLRPEIGVLGAYTYRTFSDAQFGLSNDSVTSQAFDMGLMTGASLNLSESFSLGFDFRYMWNLTNRVDTGFQQSYVKPYLKSDTPIEKMNYYTLGLMARFSF